MKRLTIYTIIFITLVVVIASVSCDSQSKQSMDNAIRERCIVEGTIHVVDSARNDISVYDAYRVRRVSDNVIFNRKVMLTQVYHAGDTIIIKFDRRYDYESTTL